MTGTIAVVEAVGFANVEADALMAGAKETTLEKLAAVVAWERFREVLESIWPWTVADGSPGQPSWDAVKMFKVLVYGKFYGNLSDGMLEENCRYHLRVNQFVGLGLGLGPDEKTIHKYRSALADSGRMDSVFAVFRAQLQAAGFKITQGTMIDASLIATPVRRKGAPNPAATDNDEAPPPAPAAGDPDPEVDHDLEELSPAQARQLDPDASWATRPGPSVFGSKDHVVADVENKFIGASCVTPANVHDSQVALGLLEKVPIPTAVYADRGYDSSAIRSGCQVLGHEPRIAARAPRHGREPTTKTTPRKEANHKIARTRVRVEHVFAAIKHDRGCRLHRGVGRTRAEAEILLTNVVYNMRRRVSLEAKLGG